MTLIDKISGDIKTAMKAKDKNRVAMLRGIKTKLVDYTMKEENVGKDFSETDFINVLDAYAKERLKTAKIFKDADETEKADYETVEAKVTAEYLPEEVSQYLFREAMSEDEVIDYIKNTVSEKGYEGMKNMRDLMADLKESEELKGRVDFKQVGGLANKVLTGKI